MVINMRTITFDVDILEKTISEIGQDLMCIFGHSGFMMVSIEGQNRFISFCSDDDYDGIIEEVKQFIVNRLSRCFDTDDDENDE